MKNKLFLTLLLLLILFGINNSVSASSYNINNTYITEMISNGIQSYNLEDGMK